MNTTMDSNDFKVGDRVVVSASITRTGKNMPGRIDSVDRLYGDGPVFVSIRYDHPTIVSGPGVCLSNLSLIFKV